jgi:hypothetical protein
MNEERFSTSGPDRELIRKNRPTRARLFNEVLAEDYPDLAKRLIPAAVPSQAEIDAMVAKAVAKAIAKAGPLVSISKALPPTMTADPFETLIAKADEGTAHPAEIDALIDAHVKNSMVPEDRGSTPRAFDRLAKSGDKMLGRLYSTRQTAARTFQKIDAPTMMRNAADAAKLTADGITEKVDSMAAELRRVEHGLTMDAARACVWNDNPELYSAYQAAKVSGNIRKDAFARVTNRVAAEKQAAEIEREIKTKADDLRRRFPGKFTPEQATSEVLAAEPETYSRWLAAKAATKPNT